MRILAMSNQSIASAEMIPASFRDPSGQVYKLGSDIYRQINQSGLSDYQLVMRSGLYEKLCSLSYVIPHEEVSQEFSLNTAAKVVLRHKKIPFISYSYEWCFSQLKDAALLTLKIAKLSLEYGMILKDASSYNVQYYHGAPVFIDIGSFTKYQEGMPWQAYRQFCQHFLAPLALMAKKDVRLGLLTKQYIDGIPLDLTKFLLPFKSKFSLSLYFHLHVHAKFQKKFSQTNSSTKVKHNMSKRNLLALLDNLTSVISQLSWSPDKTEWSNYYNETNYTDNATLHKMAIIKNMVEESKAHTIWDLGGNNGFYSRVIANKNTNIVCFDIDPVAVEANYIKTKKEKLSTMLPLIQDITNPSSTIGWAESERGGLKERRSADLIMSLALVHHLAISNNVPLLHIATYFFSLGDHLIIEFVPKEDSQVKKLLNTREDIFPDYTLDNFRKVFSSLYTILNEIPVNETKRTMFLMKRKHELL